MKSFLKNLGQRSGPSSGNGLVGKAIKVGPYNVRVDAFLGEGGFATIYRVSDNNTRAVYALKHFRLNGNQEAFKDCMNEIEVMKKLRGQPHVLTMRASAVAGGRGSESEAFLLLDLCTASLVDHMREAGNRLTDAQVLTVAVSMARALAAMHHSEPPLAHRDLKAENVLLHASGHWVLCDFGSATSRAQAYETGDAIMVEEDNIRKYTTPTYRAPEMWDLYSHEVVDTKADIWAFGVLLYLLAYGKLPFQGECKLQVLNGDYTCPDTRAPPIQALIASLLIVKPADRPNIDTVLHQLSTVAAVMNLPLPADASGAAVAATPPATSAPAASPLPAVSAAMPALASATPPPPSAFTPSSAAQPPLPRAPYPRLDTTPPVAASTSGRSLAGAATAGTPSSAGARATDSPSSRRLAVPAPAPSAAPAAAQPRAPTPPPARLASGSANLLGVSDVAAPAGMPRSTTHAGMQGGAVPSSSAPAPAATGEVEALRQRVAELQAENRALLQTVQAQQQTIRQLQGQSSGYHSRTASTSSQPGTPATPLARNAAAAAAAAAAPAPAPADNFGWAAFESAAAPSAPAASALQTAPASGFSTPASGSPMAAKAPPQGIQEVQEGEPLIEVEGSSSTYAPTTSPNRLASLKKMLSNARSPKTSGASPTATTGAPAAAPAAVPLLQEFDPFGVSYPSEAADGPGAPIHSGDWEEDDMLCTPLAQVNLGGAAAGVKPSPKHRRSNSEPKSDWQLKPEWPSYV